MESLSNHKHTPNELYVKCVKERLNKSLLVYDKEIEDSISYLKNRNTETVYRRMTKKL
jgi:hypothetical protein